MLVAERKPFDDIKHMLRDYAKVLTIGCGTCTAVCRVGGEAETAVLNAQLDMAFRLEGRSLELDAVTVERQCDPEFIRPLTLRVDNNDAILSMGCGAGVQMLADMFPHIPVFPALDTRFVGVSRGGGWFEERCRCCGHCMLGMTAGICPVTRCAKKLLNGPCGGSFSGRCEVNPNVPCAWQLIYDRLKSQNRLDRMEQIVPPMEWTDSVPGSMVTADRILEKTKGVEP